MDRIEKLNVISILEEKIQESKAGTWIGDELVIMTYPLYAFVDRVAQIGYDFSSNKKMEAKLRKMLPEIIKTDARFGQSIIDVMADKELTDSEKADMIDNNVDEFIDSHSKELSTFNQYRR